MAASEQPGQHPGGDGSAQELHRPIIRLTPPEEPTRDLRSTEPIFSGLRIPVFTSRREERERLAAEREAERRHKEQLQVDLVTETERTRTNALSVPNLTVALLNTKSSAKTATAVHLALALAYATDITTTIYDGNHDPAVHIRFGYGDNELSELTSMKKFASEVEGMFDTDLAEKVLRKIYDNKRAGDPEEILKAQAEAVAAMKVGDIRKLKRLRNRTTLGVGFVGGSTDALTEAEALNVMYGGSLISDYDIFDMGNEIGIATGQTDVRNFVYGVDQLMLTVNVGTKDSWRALGLNMRRLDAMCDDLKQKKPKEAEALSQKRENSIIVVSGLDPISYEYDPQGTIDEFLAESGIAQFYGKNEVLIGGLPFKGFRMGVPFDEQISEDENYHMSGLAIPTQLAYQRLATTLQYCKWRQANQQASRNV